jgi:hypothetical protein
MEDIFSLGWREGGHAWKWMRRLLVRDEEQVSECCALLHPIILQVGASDMWI